MSEKSGFSSLFAGSSAEGGRNRKEIVVWDCRDEKHVTKKCLKTSGLDYNHFLQDVRKVMLANFTVVLVRDFESTGFFFTREDRKLQQVWAGAVSSILQIFVKNACCTLS